MPGVLVERVKSQRHRALGGSVVAARVKRGLAIAALAAVVGVAAGCGDDDAPSGTSDTAPTEQGESPEGNMSTPATDALPGVPASNMGAVGSGAPYNASDG
jgi:hypothetical protein